MTIGWELDNESKTYSDRPRQVGLSRWTPHRFESAYYDAQQRPDGAVVKVLMHDLSTGHLNVASVIQKQTTRNGQSSVQHWRYIKSNGAGRSQLYMRVVWAAHLRTGNETKDLLMIFSAATEVFGPH